MLQRLIDYYGSADDATADYIDKNIAEYSDSDRDSLYDYIIQNRTKKFGFPDIAFLTKAFKVVPPSQKKSKKYYWCVCDNCKSEYSYLLTVCPVCWRNGYESRSYKVRVSDEKPPLKVIRFNKPCEVSADGDRSCYDCQHNNLSFCQHFGNENYGCNELSSCACARCCVRAKAVNAALAKKPTAPAVPVKKREDKAYA